jgi:hypothetical protein
MADTKTGSSQRGIQHSEFITAEAQENNRILASKSWTWGKIERGDCDINAGATFTLFSDGSTHWVCDIRSDDSGDEWDGFFRVKNLAGVVLFDTGRYHFDISEENVTKRWNEFRGQDANFAAAFNEAQINDFHCSC